MNMDYKEKNCAECGKPIVILHPTRWAYKRQTQKRTDGYSYIYWCSWKCMRASEQKEETKKMVKTQEKNKPGRKPKAEVSTAKELPEEAKAAGKPAVELVYDPSIEEEYRAEQEMREARGRRIAEKLDQADRARREMIDGIEPLMPKVLESRVIPGAVFAKRSDGMVLYNEKASIDLTAYQWFKLTEEILVAIRQMDITSASIEG